MGSKDVPLTNSSNFTPCVFFNTDSEDYRCVVILAVKRATGTFSLIGCFFMLFVIWLLRRYHSLAQKMILSLTIAAFFDSIAYVMSESHPEGSLCNFQAWWLTYFDWSALAWVCLITFNLYLNLVREMSTNRFEILYHAMAWGVPLVMATLPLLRGYYGPAGAWCWITDSHVAWRFGIWYVPLFTLILLMICCYTRIIYVANERMQSWFGTFNPERERRKVSLAKETKHLKWYPSVYLLVSLFPLINRLHNAVYPQEPLFPLTLLHVLFAPLHGLANAFVFGLDRDTWSLLSPTGIQLALQSRLCDRTNIREYHPGLVRYTQTELEDFSEDGDDEDANVLFFSPDMTLKDRGP
ncbi:si:dkey-100n23.5 [Osmerus eperlanus]|uniref:si:dkey-100n23.5 n=1 Tax=Osmerus eperlanus TaxID=29151 RepID=UPI002E0E939E